MFAKAFRLFVSSTFQDFGEERRLLQEQVFPALEAHCAAQSFGFRSVDMRWGVNDDAQLNQRTAEICLGEVIEAKGYPAPNLLILIGDRYGWVPLPFAIARDEFEAVRNWMIAQGRSEAVTDLDRVYALDENHLVPGGLPAASVDLIGAYTLRSREEELFELKAPEAWAPVETRLRDALQAAARHLQANGQLRAAELEKYTLSLTEQEIRKGLEQLAAGAGAAAANSIAWVRTTEAGEPPVRTLADAVQRALSEGNALRPDVSVGHEAYNQAFVDQITAKLIAVIDAQIAEFKAREQAPDFALQSERAIHEDFAAERLRVFVGRDSNLAAIAAHIASEARHPLVLTGISGSGKTALMARAAADAKGPVVQRFVGASAASANQRNLLISVIEDLATPGVASMPAQWEDDDNRFVGQVRDLLSGLDQPVAIFIDALDQLRAPYLPMWLPPQLNPKVKLIVSVLDDDAFAAERGIVQGLRRSLPAEAFLAIEPLSEKDGADILKGLRRDAQRGLTPDQQAFILGRFRAAGASPLYLRIAFDIARRWRSSDDPRTWGLADDVTALIGKFLDELSSIHHHEPLLVRRALGLIAAGREGLSESEAIAVLSRNTDVMAAVSSERFGARTERLPDSVWVRLKRILSALLVEKGIEGEPLISFFHRQVAEVVRARFYEPEKAALHGALAAYFDPPAENSETDPPWTRRGFVELPFQLFHTGRRERLDALLTDPVWIDRKIGTLGRTTEVVSDFERFANPADLLQPLIGRALRLGSGLIARDPRQCMTQLHGRLLSTASSSFLAALLARAPQGALFETRSTLTPPGAELARLENYGLPVDAIAILSDGRLAGGGWGDTIRLWDASSGQEVAQLDGHSNWVTSLAVLPDGRLASGSDDKTIRLWDPATGAELAQLKGHGETVTSLAVLPDGRLVSGSRDMTIRVWDPPTGAERTHFDRHGETVNALAVLPDGRLASASDDRTIRLWDPATGAEMAQIKGHDSGGNALAVLPDGRLASGSKDNIVCLWDSASGRQIAEIKGPTDGIGVLDLFGGETGSVAALAVLQGGRLAVGSEPSAIISLWDAAKAREIARLEGHTARITALAALPDGRLASGSLDQSIRLWDLATGAELARLDGHTDAVNALAVLPDGRLASGSSDGTIRLWDVASGHEIVRLDGHAGWVKALATLPNGLLASGSRGAIISLWDTSSGREVTRLEIDGAVSALAALPDGRIAAGDALGRIHWLAIKGASGMERVAKPVTGSTIEPPPIPHSKGTDSWILVLALAILAVLAAAILAAPALNDLWQAVRAGFGES